VAHQIDGGGKGGKRGGSPTLTLCRER